MNTPIPNLAPVLRAVLFALALSLFTSSGALAATITFVGVEPGTAGSGYATQNWSNGGVAKEYDLSGNVYGTAGYYQIRPIAYPSGTTIYSGVGAGNDLGITAGSNPTLYSAPAILSSITGGAGDYVNFNSYSLFRGPNGSDLYTQGGLSVPVNQGTFNTPSGTNNGYFGNAFSFTMGMSATFRVGVAVDMVASGTYAPNYVSVYNSGTGSVYSQSLTRDGTPDMTVFEIDAAAGDTFSAALWQLSGTQSAAAFGLITFDVSKYKFDVGAGLSQTNSASLSTGHGVGVGGWRQHYQQFDAGLRRCSRRHRQCGERHGIPGQKRRGHRDILRFEQLHGGHGGKRGAAHAGWCRGSRDQHHVAD